MAETSPRGIDRHRRGPAGGWWRGTSQWRTFWSACSPAVGGRQYRVRGDAQVRLRNGLQAPMKLRPLARHRPPNSSLPELDAIFIIPGAAKRHKRLRTNQSVPPRSPPRTVDHSLVAGGAERQWLQACLPDGHQPQCLSVYVPHPRSAPSCQFAPWIWVRVEFDPRGSLAGIPSGTASPRRNGTGMPGLGRGAAEIRSPRGSVKGRARRAYSIDGMCSRSRRSAGTCRIMRFSFF